MIFKRRHEEKNVRESDNFYGKGVILGSDPFEIILGKLTQEFEKEGKQIIKNIKEKI